jgi:SAM-dependent methyltransferase
MADIPNASADIYVSLRTFQSSFLDIHEAVHEAYRVLAPGGIFMASIANAYMDGNSLIRGLMPHNAKYVDLDRAHDLINQIRHQLTKLRFDEVGVHTGKAEEYVFGRKRFG